MAHLAIFHPHFYHAPQSSEKFSLDGSVNAVRARARPQKLKARGKEKRRDCWPRPNEFYEVAGASSFTPGVSPPSQPGCMAVESK
jgi:hypothetical protein